MNKLFRQGNRPAPRRSAENLIPLAPRPQRQCTIKNNNNNININKNIKNNNNDNNNRGQQKEWQHVHPGVKRRQTPKRRWPEQIQRPQKTPDQLSRQSPKPLVDLTGVQPTPSQTPDNGHTERHRPRAAAITCRSRISDQIAMVPASLLRDSRRKKKPKARGVAQLPTPTLQAPPRVHLKTKPNPRSPPAPEPTIETSANEFEVEQILDQRRARTEHERISLYLVRWKGYGPEEDSWEPRESLTNCKDAYRKWLATRDSHRYNHKRRSKEPQKSKTVVKTIS